MACNCGILHRGISLTDAGVLTVTNPNNISNFDEFNLVICLNPNNFITGAPVAYTVTINGENIPLIDIWGYPIRTDRLVPRKVYRGRYISGTGITTHISLINLCCTAVDAIANTTTEATQTTTDGD